MLGFLSRKVAHNIQSLNKKEVHNNVPQKQHKTFFEGINRLPPQGQYLPRRHQRERFPFL